MNEIGFRVKLNEYLDSKEKLKEFLDLYFEKFNTMEIKVTPYLVNHILFEYLLYLLENKNVSYHINKHYLKTPTKEDEKFLSTLNGVKNIKIITHIPNSISLYDLKKLEQKDSFEFLLENPSYIENEDYLKYIIKYYSLLKEFKNINGCLDLGHLLYKENIDKQKDYLEQLKKETDFSIFKEFHIHDYNNKKDHQKIGDGLLDIKRIYNIIEEYLIENRIILETNVDNKDLSDGIIQIDKILRR